MTREEVQVELLQMIGNYLNIPKEDIHDESTLTDLGADSLDQVELIMHIEEKFNIVVEDNEFSDVKTFDQLVDLTLKKIGEGTK